MNLFNIIKNEQKYWLVDQVKRGDVVKGEYKDQLEQLLAEWRKHCFYFTKNEALIGICIPHIEMETENEGRLFYFGVVPEWRKKGIGTEIHKIALRLLDQLEATYYIGSTDISNVHMVQIFKQNGCVLRDRKGQYRIVQTP